ncbi:MAG: ROK family protein [Candidatus Sericytochromatia bacterium]
MLTALGLDLGGTKIKAGLIDQQGQVLNNKEMPTPQTGRGEDILNALKGLLYNLTKNHPMPQCVGMGTPGLVDFESGKILGCTPNLKDWQGRSLRPVLADMLELPSWVDNDANAATFGEWKIGGGRDCRNLILLTLGTGLGSGLVLQGMLSRGHHQLGIGFGHLIVQGKEGRWCNCGQQGCLESYVSGKGIAKTYALLGGEPGLQGPAIFERAQQGERLAEEAVDETLNWLAVGVANILNTLAPERVLLGGGISRQGEKRLLEPLRAKVAGIMGMPFQKPEAIQIAQLGSDAGMIGAGLMALENFQAIQPRQ